MEFSLNDLRLLIGDESGVIRAINEINSLMGPYPSLPRKPRLVADPNAKAVLEYAEELSNWEAAEIVYKKELRDYKEKETLLNSVLIEYIKEYAGLDKVPEQYREKVYSKAYQDGHSGGYYEVYQHLCELVDIFR